MISYFTILLLIVILFIVMGAVVLEHLLNKPTKTSAMEEGLKEPPKPMKFPIIGHLHLMAGYEVPYQAFTSLGKKFGGIVKLQLGNVHCVVVNEQKNIREALITKGHHFDSRPNFERYQRLFSGNKENSLAFCDWSNTQKIRRDMLKAHTFPRAFTNKYLTLDTLIARETRDLVQKLGDNPSAKLKPLLLAKCANIFLNHFCSENFDSQSGEFAKMVQNFDEVFYEVNQGYAADFLPFLLRFQQKNLRRMNVLTQEIREFIHNQVIKDKFETFNPDVEPKDYLESLIGHVKREQQKNKEQPALDWEMALFALEDIIGGHSAVGNFLMKLFGYLVTEQDVQKKIQQEIEQAVGSERDISICDRNQLVYTEAVIYEAIRLIASPIVPRVANQSSSINGYRIEKGTVLFLNNYDLSMSEDLWTSPEKFMPERFIKNGALFKPEHFLPFGGGRRSCMGYKLVQLVSFGILAATMQNFTLKPVEGECYKVPVGSLALDREGFKIRFERR
ncbi:cytochrome P450 307a1-like [Anthonomus grandis grandis]|uniref:cytochrome P450 307a1-like n=1 Tax=Anthonomus grandis grandis TaxID=2921223 RepID=UPI0021667BD6|nr:cytochrome P450 307a1-like [Anthonomus grandis grandis]